MPFKTVRGDITEFECDAIVNAANDSLLGGGRVDGAIHRAAGPGLLEECRTLGGCRTGEAKITGGYMLPCRFVIHTVGPVWDGTGQSRRELASCYVKSLELAEKNGCKSVAFPLISSGAYGCPFDVAYEIAVSTITEYLSNSDGNVDVTLVLYGKEPDRLRDLFPELKSRLYPPKKLLSKSRNAYSAGNGLFSAAKLSRKDADICFGSVMQEASLDECASTGYRDLDMRLEHLDESFADMLFRKIDEKSMSDVQCYKKANLDRKLFSKIRSDRLYRPSKTTALALAVALELGMEETGELLLKAGYALNDSSRFDIIVKYFIEKGIYDIYEINGALFAFDQKLLGGC